MQLLNGPGEGRVYGSANEGAWSNVNSFTNVVRLITWVISELESNLNIRMS